MNPVRFLLSWKGRIGRMGYLVGWLVNVGAIVGLFKIAPHLPDQHKMLILFSSGALIMLSLTSFMTRRHHDLNEKMPVKIAAFEIPFVGAFDGLTEGYRLFTTAGSPKTNRYGQPPRF